jgi:predicted RNA binding protein YcfA (HicA-like mRNA interferase family)
MRRAEWQTTRSEHTLRVYRSTGIPFLPTQTSCWHRSTFRLVAKLPALTPQNVLRILREHGFVPDHQSGSHLVLYHPVTRRRAVVPMHRRDLPKGTLRSILREAGIDPKSIH